MSDLKEAVKYLTILVEEILDDTLNRYDIKDITHHQLNYLKVIIRMKNPTISELASELKLTKPTVTVMIDKLVAKGYVKKVKSDEDRRCSHLHIDNKGEQINDILDNVHEELAGKISRKLNETETRILMELLKKIV